MNVASRPVTAGQDAHVSALQGDDPREPEHLPGLPAPPALRPGSGEAPGGGHFGAARRGRHPATRRCEEPWEYFVVIAVRNDRGEEVTRQVVSVGALQSTEKRTFTLSVEVLPPQAAVGANGRSKTAGPAPPPAPGPTRRLCERATRPLPAARPDPQRRAERMSPPNAPDRRSEALLRLHEELHLGDARGRRRTGRRGRRA